MFIKQVSIFVENKSGKLLEIISLLGDNGIDISALSIADTAEYGILRLIVDKPNKAVNILRQNNFVVRINDVIAISIENQPGGLTKALKLLEKENINVEYLYAFVGSTGKQASVMIKVSDELQATKVFEKNNIPTLCGEDIQSEEA